MASFRPDQRSSDVFHAVCFFPILASLNHADFPLSAISVAVFAIIGGRLNVNNSLVANMILTLGSPTFLCILGSRMFFNLKEAAEHGVNVGTNWSSYSHSAIRFDEPQPDEAHPEYVTSFSCNSESNSLFASLSMDM